MLSKTWKWLRGELSLWRSLRLSNASLGKYVVLAACVLHFGWALLFIFYPISVGATPAHILTVVFGGRYRAAAVLIAVAVTALSGMRYKAKHPVFAGTGTVIALLPQQLVLLMSSLAAILAVIGGRYPDGTERVWPFILSDQLPIILAGALYSAIVVEIAFHQDDLL